MPSLSPPPAAHRRLAPPVSGPSGPSTALSPHTAAVYPPTTPLPDSDADARLRRASSPALKEAFGGKRRGPRAGTAGGLRKREWILLAAVCLIGLFVRGYKLWQPSSVVFDEVHFGGFASKYIRRKFFMDVHPPLAKLLITLSAFIGGFDGEFDFKDIGKLVKDGHSGPLLKVRDYLEPKVPYVIMRAFPMVLGLALIPISFLTLISLRLSLASALLGSFLLTFDNALITQSRLILLDSYLVFFTALTTLFWVRFSDLDANGAAFTRPWWRQLTLTGLGLGAVASCKWVGLFTIATVGLGTLRQLWLLLGNLRVTPRMWAKHFAARTLCLIVVPITFYLAMFRIHFWILNMSGDGDGFMSSEFQHTLEGHGMEDTFADVSLGSIVTIKHVNTQGGYLHSHNHAYPAGSKQQQITLYPHRDENNNWRIVNGSAPDGPVSYDWDNLPIEHILTGTKIRLEHVVTEKRLHSHDVRPPVSDVDFQNEVSGYGFPGFAGDANDDFIVEIARKTRGKWDRQGSKRLRALRSEFRLRHALTGCYLFSHKVKLPEWGFEQQEVTCNKNPTFENSLWYIETNIHVQLPHDAEMLNYVKPSFLRKFWELQGVMWRTNAGLTERHAYDSRPNAWPSLRRGINFWVQDHRQIYLIGNPLVWWLSSAAIGIYLGIRGLLILRDKRGYRDLYQPKIAFYDGVCGFLLIGWALHFLPFFLMQRQLFLHHYLPALYFAVLLFCSTFDFLTSTLRPRTRLQISAVILVLAIWSYAFFSPLTYAEPWTKGKCERAKWLKTWDFSCNDFHDNLSMYNKHRIIPSAKVDFGALGPDAETTIIDEAPEPIKNVFVPDVEPEEKTVAPVGPANEVQMQESTEIAPPAEMGDSKAEDTRAPVGLDAGAPEVTDSAEDEGGWHGGAEEGKRGDDSEGRGDKAPIGAQVQGGVAGVEMDLDDEQAMMAQAAMEAAE